MIILEDSEEAINGLAKIICQDPTFPIVLRNMKNQLLKEKSISPNEEYFQKQEDILKKAEEKGLFSTGYIFEVYANEEEDNYMIYKNIGNEMVPIIEEFKINPHAATFFSGLINHLKEANIKNLITFEPSFQDKFYSFPWFEKGETEEDDRWGVGAQHSEVSFNRNELKELEKNEIKFQTISQNDAWEFNLHLKQVSAD
jgi:hypothetical protein